MLVNHMIGGFFIQGLKSLEVDIIYLVGLQTPFHEEYACNG